jgi:hypothetical protein
MISSRLLPGEGFPVGGRPSPVVLIRRRNIEILWLAL